MANEFSADRFHSLIAQGQEKPELLAFLSHCLDNFRAYQEAILEMEGWMKLYSPAILGAQDYRDRRAELDAKRTRCHNAVLAGVSALNRLAAAQGLEPVYDGTVSEDQPYRRQVADAVLDYLHTLLTERL